MANNHFITSNIDECRIIELPRHHHANGNLTVVEDHDPIPFKIRRSYYTYDIPGGEERGGHAHEILYQLVIAVSGSFEVVLDDGNRQKTVTLNRPNKGLLITPGIWRILKEFSSGAVCLVLASEHYDESDYVREYSEFLELTKAKRNE